MIKIKDFPESWDKGKMANAIKEDCEYMILQLKLCPDDMSKFLLATKILSFNQSALTMGIIDAETEAKIARDCSAEFEKEKQ